MLVLQTVQPTSFAKLYQIHYPADRLKAMQSESISVHTVIGCAVYRHTLQERPKDQASAKPFGDSHWHFSMLALTLGHLCVI
jgi:hypothetical protein